MERNFDNSHDYNNMRHVGWEHTSDQHLTNYLFSPNTLNMISAKITHLLEGVDRDGKSIRVTHRVISNVLSSTLGNHSHAQQIGDIYSRYIIPKKNAECIATSIINRTIERIVSYIRTETEMEYNNQSLSIWNSILGGQNELGLMPTPKIKIQEKHPQYMSFNMNY